MAVSVQPTVKTLKAALTTVQPITAADRAGDGQPSAERATGSCCWPVQSPGSQGRAVGRYSPLAHSKVSCGRPVHSPGSQGRAVGRYSPLVHSKVSCCWPVQSPGLQGRAVGRHSPLAHSKVAEVGLQLILFRTGPFRPHLQGHGS